MGTRYVRVLIDSGATCNFISKELVRELVRRGKPIEVITNGKCMSLTLGDGSARECDQRVAGVPSYLGSGTHSVQECMDARVTDLMPEYQVLLGTPWLHKHNPDFDWQTGAISMKKKNGRNHVVLQGLPLPASKAEDEETALEAVQGEIPLEMVLAYHMLDEREKGAMELQEAEGSPVKSTPEAAFILDFADLFVAPTGLPPFRHINKEIALESA